MVYQPLESRRCAAVHGICCKGERATGAVRVVASGKRYDDPWHYGIVAANNNLIGAVSNPYAKTVPVVKYASYGIAI